MDHQESELLALPEPLQGCFTFGEIEVFEFCADEVIGEFGDDLGELAVAGKGDFLDLLMMVTDEAEVADETFEVLPPWKRFDMNEEPLKEFGSQKVLVDIAGELLEVLCCEAAFGLNDHDVVVFENLMNEHASSG